MRKMQIVAVGLGALGVIAVTIVISSATVQNPPPPVQQLASASAELPTPPWDRLHRVDLVAMESAADELAIAGQYQPACDQYQQILALAANHELTDPVAADVVASAQANREKLLQALDAAHAVSSESAPETVPQLAANSAGAANIPPLAANVAPLAVPPVIVQQDPPQVPSKAPTGDAQPHGLFADAPRGRPSSSGSANPPALAQHNSALGSPSDTNLTDDSKLQWNYGTDAGEPPPQIMVQRSSVPSSGLMSDPTESVTVSINGRPGYPVTGTVDGHPYALGGPGEPMSMTFNNLPWGAVPVTLNGQQYSIGGSGPGQITVPLPVAKTPPVTAAPTPVNGSPTKPQPTPIAAPGPVKRK